MRLRTYPLFAAIFMLVFVCAAGAQTAKTPEPKKAEAETVVSSWDVVITAPGQDYAGTLKIEKDKDAFKGSLTTELGEAPLSGLKVTGDSFTGSLVVNAQGQALEGTISGKSKDGKIAGEINLSGLGTIPYTGKKK